MAEEKDFDEFIEGNESDDELEDALEDSVKEEFK